MNCGGQNNKWNKLYIEKKYGYLTVLGRSSKKWKSGNDTFVICKCICGKITEPRFYDLRKRRIKSCGCKNKRKPKSYKYKFKFKNKRKVKHGLSKTALYSNWNSMLQRCNNANNKAYKYYGGRGITVCKKWHDFLIFRFQMRKKYLNAKKKYKEERITIERVNNNKGYYYNNCIYTTMKEQNKNRRKNKLSLPIKAINRKTGKEVYGESQVELSKKINLTQSMIGGVIRGKYNSSEWIIKPQ